MRDSAIRGCFHSAARVPVYIRPNRLDTRTVNISTPTAELLTPKELFDSAQLVPDKDALAQPCGYLLGTPGKQIRAQLVFQAAGCGPLPSHPNVRPAARAVELFHAATLAHDDVVDGSALRRGKPTVGSRYGTFAAGYSGGWLFAQAASLLAHCGDEAIRLFAETACAVCDGQMVETQDLYNVDRSLERYEQAISGKTAELFVCAVSLGATAAEANASVLKTLAEFGHHLGMAFQIADDLLDLVGADTMGKRTGDDLRHGIFTLPVIHALREDPALRDYLRQPREEPDITSVVQSVRRCGGLEVASKACRRHADAARAAAESVAEPDGLSSLVDRVLARCPDEDRRGLLN